jgi:STE24 endopeptidase
VKRALVCAVLGLAIVAGTAEASAAPRARVQDFFTQSDIARARDYRGTAYILGFGALGFNIAVLALLGLGRGSRRLAAWSARFKRWWFRGIVLTGIVTIAPALLAVPLALASWRHERAFGLATNSAGSFLADYAKETGFSLGASLIVALIFLVLARRLRRGWPLVVAPAGIALTFLAIFVLPLIYEPAFSSFHDVDPSTRARVIAIAAREGVRVDRVLVSNAGVRTTTENAYVSGFGATKRVVLYDTLLAHRTPAEVDLVVAHEIGHVKHNDILKGALFGSAGVVGLIIVMWLLLRSNGVRAWIGARDPGDPAVVPFLAFVIAALTLLSLPLANWVTRNEEAAADRAAIVATNDPQDAVRLEVDLARENLSDLAPNGFVRWAFFTHPTTMERIQAALDYEGAQR